MKNNTDTIAEKIGHQPKQPDGINCDQVIFFFRCFKTMYPSAFSAQIPSREAFEALKMRHAPVLSRLTLEQIDKGFAKLSELRQHGDNRLEFPDIDKVLGVITGKIASVNAAPAGIYTVRQDRLSSAPVSDRSKAVGIAALDELKGLLGMKESA